MRHLAFLAALVGCTNQAGVTCPPGQTLCANTCVFTSQDPMNCGACANVCAGNTVCISGMCGCPAGLMACNGMCVDVKSDVANCGMCGTACPAAQVCSMSACAGSCATGLTDCSRNCVDTMTDDRNCGTCGNVCGQGEKCTAGACAPECPSGQMLCSGKCVNTNNDGSNCGACGNVCPKDFFCVFGECILGCPKPLTRCIPDGGASDGGSECVDTRSDPENCGGCGGADVTPSAMPHVCAVDPTRHTDAVCDDGRCAATCENGFFDCRVSSACQESLPGGPDPVPLGCPVLNPPPDLFCFDFHNDPCACGGCGFNAPGFISQFDGVTGAFSICIDENRQETGTTIGACCAGKQTFINQSSSCGSSCADVAPCPSSAPSCCGTGTPTGHACTNEGSDLHNCGACGDGQFNNGFGDCTMMPSAPPPAAPLFAACCSGGCSDLNNDVLNCGACGNDCNTLLPSSSPLCCAGPSPSPGIPTCFDGLSDLHNCGQCGRDCNVLCGGSGLCVGGNCQCP